LESACLLTVAEYLRAVRAGFPDLKDVLDGYTSLPIPAPQRKLAEAAPLPRLTASARTCENGDSQEGTRPRSDAMNASRMCPRRADARCSPRFQERRIERTRAPDREEELRVLRIRRRAGYWDLRRLFEFYLHTGLHAAGAPPGSRVRRGMAAYARRVFTTLFRTRGAKELKRVERLTRLRGRARKYCLNRDLAEDAEAIARLAYDEMAQHDELDWMPSTDRAFAVMSVKPKRRVVTDAEMCLAEWWKVAIPYDGAVMAAYERTHKAALDVADSARCDTRTLGRYRQAAMRAANIARSTAPDSPRRKKSIDDWHATDWPEEMDPKLLERMLAVALAAWDALLPTLPPAPGPRPM
jgi:hypothetical protein